MKRPLLVGIAGGSGSGKTTLAKGLYALTERIGSVLISQNDYYLGLPDGASADTYNFDEPAALDLKRMANDLAALKAGTSVELPVYDFARHCRAKTVRRVEPCALILVEGLFLYATHPLRNVFDLRYFVDVPTDERLRQRLRNDLLARNRGAQEILDLWDRQVEPMYLRHVLPTREKADCVLSLAIPDDPAYCEQVVVLWKTIEDRLGLSATRP